MAEFYSYLWLRSDGSPYYVGKGAGLRAFRSKAHAVRRPKDRSRIVVFQMRDEMEAFESEIALIELFGRKDLGTGCLWNRTDGGEGASNVPVEVRMKRSLAAKAQWADPKLRARTVAGMKAAHKGTFTLAHREAIAAAKTGTPWSAAQYAARKVA